MYEIPCARCGQKEIFHSLEDDIDLYKSGGRLSHLGGWELDHYGEELNGIDDLHKHIKGYQKNFGDCSGFSYSKRISATHLARLAVGYPYTIHFVVEKVAKKATRLLELIEEDRASSHTMREQRAVYIMVEKNGRSYCYVGD